MVDELLLTVVIMLNKDAPRNLSLMFFVQVKSPPLGLFISLNLWELRQLLGACIFWQGTADEGARGQ